MIDVERANLTHVSSPVLSPSSLGCSLDTPGCCSTPAGGAMSPVAVSASAVVLGLLL